MKKEPAMEEAARNLEEETGLFVEEPNRFISWVILKRIHHNEHVPALYENTKFMERGIYVILNGGNISTEQGPTLREYRRFMNDVRGGRMGHQHSLLLLSRA